MWSPGCPVRDGLARGLRDAGRRRGGHRAWPPRGSWFDQVRSSHVGRSDAGVQARSGRGSGLMRIVEEILDLFATQGRGGLSRRGRLAGGARAPGRRAGRARGRAGRPGGGGAAARRRAPARRPGRGPRRARRRRPPRGGRLRLARRGTSAPRSPSRSGCTSRPSGTAAPSSPRTWRRCRRPRG